MYSIYGMNLYVSVCVCCVYMSVYVMCCGIVYVCGLCLCICVWCMGYVVWCVYGVHAYVCMCGILVRYMHVCVMCSFMYV